MGALDEHIRAYKGVKAVPLRDYRTVIAYTYGGVLRLGGKLPYLVYELEFSYLGHNHLL